jgi:hypothetical protein
MKRVVLAAVAILGLIPPGYAGFTNQVPREIGEYTNLECVPVVLQPPDHDRNPIYKISVNLQLDNGRTKEINVQHTASDGTTYDRSHQYSNASIWQNPGYNESYWEGTRMRGRYTMTGRIYRAERGQWFYEETLFERGQQKFFMRSRCHIEFEGD